ncbi:MAG: CHAT domain-containing tetratricopeptide repeat protein [Balneolaceae bacterium]|nr:CHAT domain-containing tetratricopeptide repeat protein [Balneolaceae bacterium]
MRNLYVFYRRQNETSLALNYLNQALEISQKYNLPEETAGVLLSLGVHKRETENLPNLALDHFYDALELSENSNNYQRHFNSYIELGETYHELNNPRDSEKYFKEAIAISESREDNRNYSMAIVRYSNMLTDNQRLSEADTLMQSISDSDLEEIPFNLEVLGKNVKIKLLSNRGELEEALAFSSTTIEEIFDWLQESADMQTGHMRMDEEFSEAFQLHTELLRQLGNFEDAIAVNGRLRNLSRTGFYNNPLLKSQILSEEELIRDHNLSNRIEDLRSRYANATEEQKIYLGNQLASAKAERNNLLNQAFPNYSTSDFEEMLPQARNELNSDQMIIYFSVFEDQIFQYFITTQRIEMKVYPADEQMELLERAVQSFGHASTDLNLLHDVYRNYFADNIPSGIEHIYMIPDGIFYRIPIEILPVNPANSKNSYGSSTYLIENYSVSYLNTLSDLLNTSARTDFSFDLAGFGVSNFSEAGHPNLPDLPFSPQEVTSSSAQLDKFRNKQFFINDSSTESNFRNVAGKAKIIHLATHSKVDDENPLFSSLYMYSGNSVNGEDSVDNKNDGIVHAYELFDLNLNADLIFLSSCESGSGGYLKGSGILGFSRAFAYAGAQSLSINLWPIRDQTASEISSEFYASLNQGNNKAEALREARIHYLNNSNSDPYLWGAFIMYGNISPAVDNYKYLIQLLLSGLLISGLGFIAIAAYQRKTLIRSWIFF